MRKGYFSEFSSGAEAALNSQNCVCNYLFEIFRLNENGRGILLIPYYRQ